MWRHCSKRRVLAFRLLAWTCPTWKSAHIESEHNMTQIVELLIWYFWHINVFNASVLKTCKANILVWPLGWEFCRPSRPLELFIMFLGPFMSSFCIAACCYHDGVYLISKGVGIYMNARTQSFPGGVLLLVRLEVGWSLPSYGLKWNQNSASYYLHILFFFLFCFPLCERNGRLKTQLVDMTDTGAASLIRTTGV